MTWNYFENGINPYIFVMFWVNGKEHQHFIDTRLKCYEKCVKNIIAYAYTWYMQMLPFSVKQFLSKWEKVLPHISIYLGQKFAQSLLFMDLPTLFYDARHMKTVTKPLKIYVYYLMAWLDHKLYAYFIFIAVCRTVPPTILIASTATIPLVPPTANVHNLFPFRYTFYVMNVILPSLMTSVLLLSIFFCTPAQKVCIHSLQICKLPF